MLPTHAEIRVENPEGVVGGGAGGSMGEMVVGRSYQVSCTVHGSRPPPKITWFINNSPIGIFLVYLMFENLNSNSPFIFDCNNDFNLKFKLVSKKGIKFIKRCT